MAMGARTINWMLGVAAFLWATNAGIAAYANIAAGLHMGQHMALTMLIPILLVMGAQPLALRALLRPTQRHELGTSRNGSSTRSTARWPWSSPTRWSLWCSTSPGSTACTCRVCSVSLMGSHVGHVAMQTHFVLSGYLFYWILIGIDPRHPAPAVLAGVHAPGDLVGSAWLLRRDHHDERAPVAAEWFSAVQPPWVTDLLQDTVLGGQAAWAIGEFPLLIVAIALAVQWSRSDERDARRMDRQADRDGGRELPPTTPTSRSCTRGTLDSNPPSDPEAHR